MSDYYYGLEFLKASTDVYKTVFPWLSERLEVSFAFFFCARLGTEVVDNALTSNFAITYIR